MCKATTKSHLKLDSKLKEILQCNLQLATRYACISIFLLLSAFTLTMPHLQSRRDTLQCDTLCLGSMTSARSTLTLLGSAIMGKLSDSNSKRFGSGRIICLYIGSFATLIGFVIGASAFSIRGLWLSMIPGALFQQNFNVFKAMLADYHEEISHFEQLEKETYNTNDTCGVSPLGCNKSDSISRNTSSERAGSVGKLGMSVGIAFMAGPLLGATLVKSYECAVILAIVLVCLSTLWISKMPKLQLQSNAIQMR